MSLIRKSMMSASAAISISGGRFLLMAILARRLSSTDFGQFVYAQWLVDMAFMICAFGINGVASRYIAEYEHDPSRRAVFLRRWLPWALILPVLSGLVVVAGGIFSGLILTPLGYTLLAAWAITTGWWSMQTAALSGHQRFDLILSANLTSIALVIPAVLLIPTDSGFPELLFSAMALSSLFACGFGVRQNTTRLAGSADAEAVDLPWSKIRAYAVNMWLTGLLGALVWSRGELPLVRAHLGDEGVAQYTVALTLFFGAMQGVMLWVSGVAPHLTSEWGRGQKTQAVAVARRFSDVQLLVSGCVALLLTCFGPEVLGIIFGAVYRASAPSLAVLILGLITVSASAQNHLLQIDTDGKFNRNTSLAGLFVLYLIASITIPWLGIAGAAIARALTMWGLFLISLIMVWRSWGGTVLSGRNVLVVIGAVSIPALVVAAGEIHYVIRALIALPCLAALVGLIRGEDGKLVAIDVATTGWLHLRQCVAGDRQTS
ncbi:MAG: lipopolysaccharide biosynthesis protein [Syntrophales bacterium]|nr:lipopolysaccharide biosynthesis protein [Syntrophales bacterium]